MNTRKHFVSATDANGAFTGRGMVSMARALEVLDEFAGAPGGGRAVFMVISDHDGRIELRHGENGFSAVVTARRERAAMLGGLLPARAAIVWHRDGLDKAQAAEVVGSLYRLSGGAFRILVQRELAE